MIQNRTVDWEQIEDYVMKVRHNIMSYAPEYTPLI